jgi:aryl-alcohol dehydrogenase-like predicted oxidoreductase
VNQKSLQTRIFGSTNQKVTRTGLGGEGVLRTHDRNREAREVIHETIAQGINYFDSARVYADSELYYGYIWKEQPELRARHRTSH